MKLGENHCIPCQGGITPFSEESENNYIKEIQDWEIDRTSVHKLTRVFTFKSFSKAIEFVNAVAAIAEKEGQQ